VVKPLKQIPLILPPEGVTMASLVKAAWAVVLAQLTEQRDVVFGHVFTGRDAPIAEVEKMAAPLITISPIRVTIEPSWTVGDLLNHVQSQYTRAMPFAHLEFNHIREHATTWSSGTEISSIVTHQNGDQVPTFSLGGVECPWKPWDIGIPPHFHIISFPVENHLVVQLTVSSKKFSPDIVEHMLDRLCKTISAFSEGALKPLVI
jgi:non-ribosomal peptide synthetase component F